VPNKLALYICTAIHLLVISAPLLFVEIRLHEYLIMPNTWIFYLLNAVFCLLEGYASFHLTYEVPAKTEKIILPYFIGICILIVFWISVYEYAYNYQSNLIQTVVGCLLFIFGIAVRYISIKTLNKYFVSHVALLKNHQLITNGIYSFVRHPSELGLLSICFGVVFLLSSIKGLWVVIFVLLPLVIYRISMEDKLLQLKFTAEYEKYKTITPGLLPKLITHNANRE
jgi:protein-S-isoprenylcysteine O-methyltransferase